MHHSPPVQIVYGDIDNNGNVSVDDALLALQYSVDKIKFTDDQITRGDVDDDSKVDASDALLILQHSVDKIKKFPIEE